MPDSTTAAVEGIDTTLVIECLARFVVEKYNIEQNNLVLEFRRVLDAIQQQELVFDIKLEVFNRVTQTNKKYVTTVSLKKELTGLHEGDA